MGLEMLVYSPLMEEEAGSNIAGWEKETLEYVCSHRSKIYGLIRRVAKSIRRCRLQPADVDDIYQEVVTYLYKCDDYNICKAVERASNGSIVSLEGYIGKCIKFCVIRYCTQLYKEEKGQVNPISNDEDGKELSILDNIADSSSSDSIDSVVYDLRSICKSCESMRYKFGPDIYLVVYVRLLTLVQKKQHLYKDLMDLVGITKRELSNIEKESCEEEILTTFVKAIEVCGIDEAIKIIRPYVFSSNFIDSTISAYS